MDDTRPMTLAKARLEIAMTLSIYRTERPRTRNRDGLQMRCLNRLERTRRTLQRQPIVYPIVMREIDGAVSEIAGDRATAGSAAAG
jgi:hypothetical protein